MSPPIKSQGFSKRLDALQESATLKLNAMANQLKAQGLPVINLTAGEPDFDADPTVIQAVVEAAHKAGINRYTPVPGILELRKKVAEVTMARQVSKVGAPIWNPENVVICNGGKQALFNAFLALLNVGDEVVIPGPYWLSYPELVKFAEGIPIEVNASVDQGYKITADQLRKHLTPRTRVFILNSPSNPTGATYTDEELAAFGDILKDFPNTWIFSDEIYEEVYLGEKAPSSFLKVCPHLADRTATFSGLSKSTALTGWRIGWAVSPVELAKRISTLQGQSTSGICALAQAAALAALRLPPEYFTHNREIYARRLKTALEILGKSSKVKVAAPSGAFYVFINVGPALRQMGLSVETFCERLLKEAMLAVVPGTPFGDWEAIRISFALSDEDLIEGCNRLVQFGESTA